MLETREKINGSPDSRCITDCPDRVCQLSQRVAQRNGEKPTCRVLRELRHQEAAGGQLRPGQDGHVNGKTGRCFRAGGWARFGDDLVTLAQRVGCSVRESVLWAFIASSASKMNDRELF